MCFFLDCGERPAEANAISELEAKMQRRSFQGLGLTISAVRQGEGVDAAIEGTRLEPPLRQTGRGRERGHHEHRRSVDCEAQRHVLSSKRFMPRVSLSGRTPRARTAKVKTRVLASRWPPKALPVSAKVRWQ